MIKKGERGADAVGERWRESNRKPGTYGEGKKGGLRVMERE